MLMLATATERIDQRPIIYAARLADTEMCERRDMTDMHAHQRQQRGRDAVIEARCLG
jgi:hypothetical protein